MKIIAFVFVILFVFSIEYFFFGSFRFRGDVHKSEFKHIEFKGKLYHIPCIWIKLFALVQLLFQIIIFVVLWSVYNIDYAMLISGMEAIIALCAAFLFVLTAIVYAWIKFQKTLYEMVEYLIEQHPEAVNNESYVVIKIKKVLRDDNESCSDRAIKRAFKKYRELHTLSQSPFDRRRSE